jgi:hypothetical protein
MMRTPIWYLSLLLLGCSSSSNPVMITADAGNPTDAHHDAHRESGPPPKTVCEPATFDAGSKDGESDAEDHDAATDAGAKDVADKDGSETGPIHCTLDTQCPPGDVCERASSMCIPNMGATLCTGTVDGGGAPGKCSANDNDMCCTVTAGCIPSPAIPLAGGGPCCPGATGDTYCQAKLADDSASCGSANVCTTCMDTCITANDAAYQKFLAHQVADCGCIADGACYDVCHTSTTTAPDSACGMCLTSQTQEGLGSTCTLAAAADCSSDPGCTAYQACIGTCPM